MRQCIQAAVPECKRIVISGMQFTVCKTIEGE